MAINVEALMLRLAALEKEALGALSPAVIADAVPRFVWAQEAFPYFTNRLGAIGVDEDSEDFDVYTIDVVARLVIGHVTEGYVGETDTRLQTWIPHLIQYVNKRQLLQSAAYPLALDDITQARVVSCTGFTIFANTIIGATQVGTEFTIRAEFEMPIEQQYL